MLILFETSNGYFFIEKKKHSKLILKITSFYQYKTKMEAFKSIKKIVNGLCPRTLKKFIKNNVDMKELVLTNGYKIGIFENSIVGNFFYTFSKKISLFRKIRKKYTDIITSTIFKNENFKRLHISHNLYCKKIKFEHLKIDRLIIHASDTLINLNEKIRLYIMFLRELYSHHFPELNFLIKNDILYVKLVTIIGDRNSLKFNELEYIKNYTLKTRIKYFATNSIGSNISNVTMKIVISMSNHITSLFKFKKILKKYINNRMYITAPNITAIIGSTIGAALIKHVGSLKNLSKYPASTLQLFGAEKTLFNSIKNDKKNPKYGILYHSELVKSSSNHIKGKINRMLANKTILSVRIDTLSDHKYGGAIGIRDRIKIKKRICYWEKIL